MYYLQYLSTQTKPTSPECLPLLGSVKVKLLAFSISRWFKINLDDPFQAAWFVKVTQLDHSPLNQRGYVHVIGHVLLVQQQYTAVHTVSAACKGDTDLPWRRGCGSLMGT